MNPRRGDGGGMSRSDTGDTSSWIARSVGGRRGEADAEMRGSGRFRGATYGPAPARDCCVDDSTPMRPHIRAVDRPLADTWPNRGKPADSRPDPTSRSARRLTDESACWYLD